MNGKKQKVTPDLIINRNGPFDTMAQNLGNPNLQEIELGTVWNEWQDMWTGAPVETVIETYLESENKHLDLVYQEEF